MALSLTSGQAGIISSVDTTLQTAFSSGVDNVSTPILPAIFNYSILTAVQQQIMRQVFESMIAAFVSTMGFAGVQGSTFSGTVALAKLTTGGTQGSLTVSNGLITAYVAPT